MRARVMMRSVDKMTLAEIRHELEVIPVWIRDITRPKMARIKLLQAELKRRKRAKGELDAQLKSRASDCATGC